MFTGPEGVGKQTTALAVTAALFCPNKKGQTACGQCRSCQQVASQTHPDLFRLAPEDDRTIKIEQVRLLLHSLSLQPMQAGRKVAIIKPADTLTIGAANALLKSLEEPGEHNISILITSAPARLPATIVSRCHRISFAPLTTEVLTKLLPELLRTPLALAGGSVTQAASFGKWHETLGHDLPSLFQQFALATYHQLKPLFAKLPNHASEIALLLEGLRAICRDLLLLKALKNVSTEELLFANAATTLRTWAPALDREQVEAIVAEIGSALQALTHNVTPLLLWESLAFAIQDIIAGGNIIGGPLRRRVAPGALSAWGGLSPSDERDSEATGPAAKARSSLAPPITSPDTPHQR